MLYKSIALPIELRRPEWADIIIICTLFGQRACSLQTKKYSIYSRLSSNKSGNSPKYLVSPEILLYNYGMDISVSRLNKRMALQLPAEFPLGLVFVVGKVRNLSDGSEEGGLPYFYLAENDHMLRCHLSERALQEASINEGDMIRAGGHLAFDIQQADYFLLARDVELLPEHRPSRTTLAPILADIKKRSQAASLVPAELPDWVQQIAPPEFQRTAEPAPEAMEEQNGQPSELPAIEEAETAVETTSAPLADDHPPLPEGLTDDLVAFLSEAMDNPEDVELTQEMVTELAPAIQPEKPLPQPTPISGDSVPATSAAAPPAEEETRIPWVVVLTVLFLLIAILSLILALAFVVTR